MKPCSKNRKQIAWLALGALGSRKAAALRDHLALCEGCHRYWEQISSTTNRIAAAEPDSNLAPSAYFHQRVSERLRAAESKSVLKNLAAWFRGSTLNWHVALPAIAALVIALTAILSVRRQVAPSQPAPRMDQVVSASDSGSDPAPTLANYQIVASQSLEKLDELLTRQGNKPLPPAPMFTVSGLVLANASF
jgi:anti-sigma-K factor RskA